MIFMSFNTQSCKNFFTKKKDYKIMAEAIKSCNADVVGLNEVWNKSRRFFGKSQVKNLSKLTGLKYCYFAKSVRFGLRKNYGNGLLSRYPITKAETVSIPDPDPRGYKGYYETRCVLKAVLENGVTVMVSHFGLNPDEQENAVATVVSHLEGERCVLMGDFNVTPKSKLLAPIRERMTDTAAVFTENLHSFPSDNPKAKIDYIFVSADIKVLSADIPAIVASDHRPHVASLELI